MGCVIFSYLVQWGIVSSEVYRPYTDSIQMFEYSLDFRDRRLGSKELPGLEEGMIAANDPALYGWRRKICKDEYAPIVKKVRPIPHDDGMKSVLDTEYKFPQTDFTHRKKWSLKYITPCDFSIPIAIGGQAIVFRYLRETFGDNAPKELWQTIAIFGGTIYAFFLLAYMYKAFFHPRKVYMEFELPMCRNGGVIIALGMLLYAWLLTDYSAPLQVILLWIGMTTVPIHAVIVIAGWIKNRQFSEHTNPGTMMPALALLMVALVLPPCAVGRENEAYYIEAAMWFFGIGIFLLVSLWAVTFYHSFTSPWTQDPMRVMVGLWMAGCFLAQLSYQSVWGADANPAIIMMFFCTGVLMFLVCLYLIYPGRWLFRGRFMITAWLAPFCLDIFALACLFYFNEKRHTFSRVLLWVSLGFTGWANYAMLMHTFALIIKRNWPKPMVRNGPLMISKYQHEAMKEMSIHLLNEIEFSKEPIAGPNTTLRIQALWKLYSRFATNHLAYEDAINFKEISMHFPAHVRLGYEKHDLLKKQIEEIHTILAAPGAAFPSEKVVEHLNEHIDCAQWEEDHLGPMSRKNNNLQLQQGMMEKIFAHLPWQEWEFQIVATVRYIPMHMWRLIFLKMLTWYFPHREQMFGKLLYRGLVKDPLGDAKYELIVQDLPEIVSRDTSSDWIRYM